MQKFDSLILGAGIIGVCTALHLQARGQHVCLIDKRDPGEGASFGNAGLIERSSVIPYAFPRDPGSLLKYALNNRSDVRYDPKYLPHIAGWLFQFWKNSSVTGLAQATQSMLPLVEASVREHDRLIAQAGCENLIRADGWMEVFRDQKNFDHAVKALPELDRFNLNYTVLDKAGFVNAEPSMKNIAGAIHWLDPKTVTDPSALVKIYAKLFSSLGGKFYHGDAQDLQQREAGWAMQTAQGDVSAVNVVVALGAQSNLICRRFNYPVPLAVKRGTHLHFHLRNEAQLHHSLVEVEGGYVLAPMRTGIRLTTGIEFAAPDAPVNRILIGRAEKRAREIMPDLGAPVESQPWLGLRPCLPDMCPVVGAAPMHPGLWFNFGHAHHGLTLGAASGRLLAEMLTGEQPYIDPHPYRIGRFS